MHNFKLVNADTDSIMIAKPDGSPFSEEEQEKLLKELNDLFPEHINWDADGYFKRVLVLAAKNYVLDDGEKDIKKKGSGLKDQKKPKALLKYIDEMIQLIIDEKKEECLSLYENYVQQIINIKDIRPWCKKLTVTEKITQCVGYEKKSKEQLKKEGIRLNEIKVYHAIKHTNFQEGDKIYVFYKPDTSLCLGDEFDGEYDKAALLKLLYTTTKIFENEIDYSQFKNYSLRRNQKLLGLV